MANVRANDYKIVSSIGKDGLKHRPVVGGLSDEFGLLTDVALLAVLGPARCLPCVEAARRISLALDPGYALRTNAYRPNSRSISQPSSPAAGSGRTEVRVGAGLPTVLAGGGALTGMVPCETVCTKFEKKPPACKPGRLATGTP